MSLATILVHGSGVVSPAGWGTRPFRAALDRGDPLVTKDLPRPGWDSALRVRPVPPASPRPDFLGHARLRRASPIAHYVVAAALEALGDDEARCRDGSLRLGIILCAMSGCVNYSRRFYDEVLKDPATASPLVFPETVYNSPASHLAALLGSPAINYTLVGDPGTFLLGLAVAANWLADRRVDGCVVVGAEETDWLTSDAMRLFERKTVVSAGAGALYLRRAGSPASAVRLGAVTDPRLYCAATKRAQAARLVRAELPPTGPHHLLCDGLQGVDSADRDERSAWIDWPGPRLSPKIVLGEGLMAGAAWQCVAAVDGLRQNRYDGATVSVVGCNQQAIAAQFVAVKDPNSIIE